MRGAELCSRVRRGCGPLGTGRRTVGGLAGMTLIRVWRGGMRMYRGHRCSMDWPAQSTSRGKRTSPLGPDAPISTLTSQLSRVAGGGSARFRVGWSLASLGRLVSRLVCRGDASCHAWGERGTWTCAAVPVLLVRRCSCCSRAGSSILAIRFHCIIASSTCSFALPDKILKFKRRRGHRGPALGGPATYRFLQNTCSGTLYAYV